MAMGRPWSLQRRIYDVAAFAILVAWVGGGLALYASAQREYERMCHENLANLAATVLSFAEHELREVLEDTGKGVMGAPVHTETVATLGKRYSYQIWSRSGELLLRSYWAPDKQRMAPKGRPGLHEFEVDGRMRDVFVLRSRSGEMEIQVSDAGGAGFGVSAAFMRDSLLAFMLALVPVLYLTWRLIRDAFTANRDMARELGSRSANNFAALRISDPPRELLPVIGAINGLLTTVSQAMERERSFTAMASHELRTPLASIRLQAQVLARSTDPDERATGVTALTENVDRCARLVTQLLTLARTDAQSADGIVSQPVRIDETCAEVLIDFAEIAERRHIRLECQLDVNEVVADKVALQTLLRNLVSNAMTYTPDAGAVRITAAEEAGRVVLSVDDSGNGIPEAERALVLQRFYRGSSHAGIGVGLGLSIVASIVQAHHAAIKLCESSFGGLRVEVHFAHQG